MPGEGAKASEISAAHVEKDITRIAAARKILIILIITPA
jgi:hypothetical protein